MFRFIKVDTSGASPCPVAHPLGPKMQRGFPWCGGTSWQGLLSGSIFIEVTNGDESPSGLPDFFRTISLYVVSGRLRALLKSFGAEIEFWPTSVAYRGQSDATTYFVANPLIQVPALDMTRSAVELDDVGIAVGAKHVVLDESKLAGARWAKVRELQQVAIDEQLQSALRNSGFRRPPRLERHADGSQVASRPGAAHHDRLLSGNLGA